MASRHHPSAVEPLTRRETEVLEAVGRRLTNAELADHLHVSVRTVESHIAALRRKLGATTRGQLIEAARAMARRAAVAGSDPSLIGRDRDLVDVASRLEGDRLVTLVGPAGVGKSRLARELARRYEGEVRLVDLVGVSTDGVAVAVADAIGVGSAEGADVEGGIRLALAHRTLLLLIDNADLVTPALGALVSPLLEASTGLQVLVTSRRRLGLAVEAVHPLRPLGLPDRDDPEVVATSPAGRLLVERARAVRSDFVVDESNAAAVAGLCRRLDGLPLGLELAAARLGSLGVAELESLLADRIDLLDRSDPSGRHRSLTAAVDWSWSSLGPGERLVLGAAASLPGPCLLDELRMVVGSSTDGDGGEGSPVDVARALLDLVDQSMVEPRLRPDRSTSYRVLETIRAVAIQRTDPADVARFRAAHARYHADGVEEAVRRARGGQAWDYDDDVARRTLLGALRWAAANDAELGSRLLIGIAQRYELDPTVAVLDELRRVVVDHALPQRWPSEPLGWAAVVLNYLDLEILDRGAAEALARATSPRESAIGHWAVGFAAGYRGREEEAMAELDRARAGFEEQGETNMVGLSRMAEGLIRSDPGAAMAAFESSLLTCLQAGNRWHANSVRLMLARRAIEAGDRLDEVPGWLDECERFAADHDGLRHDRAHALAARAEWAASAAGPGPDLVLAERAAEAFRQHGDLRCLVRALLLLARTEPDPERALGSARRAVGAAVLQGDRRAQVGALEVVAGLARAVEDPILAAQAEGALLQLTGRPASEERLAGPSRTPLLEGLVEGPALVAL